MSMNSANPELASVSSQTKQGAKHTPGETGIWVMVMGDMMVFALFFLIFLIYRGENLEMFRSSRALLDMNMGAINTVFLLTSSGFVVGAMNAVRIQRDDIARKLLPLAFLCGIAFVVVKYFEYSAKLDLGYTVQTNQFFMFYYIFTGIHLLHLLIGLGVLTYMIRVVKGNEPAITHIRGLECGATFWHMVDLLWIILFPLLYLVN